MKIDEIIQKAEQLAAKDLLRMQTPAFVKTIGWLHYLGLLRHNKIHPQRATGLNALTLKDALEAAELEPRVYELLPATLTVLPEAFKIQNVDVPEDLADILQCIKENRRPPDFHGIPADKFLYWLNAPVMEVARRRLDYRNMPRNRSGRATTEFAEIIRQGRMMLAKTQKQLANEYGISLRVLRDLEQGKMDASIKALNQILAIFGRRLHA